MKKLPICVLALLVAGIAGAQTAPVTILQAAPTIGATCSVSTGFPSVVVEKSTGRSFCCKGAPLTWQYCDVPACAPDPPSGTCTGTALCQAATGRLWACVSGNWGQLPAGDVSCTDCIALGTETTGNYAAGDAEAGNATGVACTDCIALGTETTGGYAWSTSEGGAAANVSCTDCVALGTETEGNYVSSVSGGTLLTCSGSGEAAAVSCGFDYAAVCDATLGNGTQGAISWTFNVSGTDVTVDWTYPINFTAPIQATSFLGNATTATTASGVSCTDCIALGTETTGSYAAGDAEAGNATGVACTNCVALGTETEGDYVASMSAGTYLDCTGTGVGASVSCALDPTEIGDVTWANGSGSPIWRWNVTLTDDDPTMQAGVGKLDFDHTKLETDDTITATGGFVGNASTATALAADPADCGANAFATGIAASGALTCATPALGTDTSGNYVASLVAGTGIDVGAAAEGGTPSVDVDTTEIGTTTWGTAGGTWTFEGGAVDPTFTWASDSVTVGVQYGQLKISGSGTLNLGPNVVNGWTGNAISGSGVYSSVIAGGGTSGSENTNSATGGSLSVIGGGYDNVMNGDTLGGNNATPGIASTIAGGAHHTIGYRTSVSGTRQTGGVATHATIGGGSYNLIDTIVDANNVSLQVPNDYSTIAGGTRNRVSQNSGNVGGGAYNVVTQMGGTVAGGGISGYPNTVSATKTHANANAGAAYSDPANAYDNDATTAATNAIAGGGDDGSHVWTFAAGTLYNGQLYVVHQIGDSDITQAIEYSTNGGVAWTSVANSTATKTGSRVALPATQTLADLQVRATSAYVSGDGATASVFEVFYVYAAYGTIGGGYNNTCSGDRCVIAGGNTNTASGTYAAVAGGGSNTASGQDSTVGAGTSNTAAATGSTVGGGFSNTATALASYAVVVGGYSNTVAASDEYAVIAGGRSNATDGITDGQADYSFIEGGYYGIAKDYGAVVHASGRFAAAGDAQTSVYVLRKSTTDGTAAVDMALDGASNFLNIATDTTYAFDVTIVARRTDADGESARYRCYGVIDNNAGTTALVGAIVCDTAIEDTAGWDATVTANDASDYLNIEVTGEAGKTIYWVARVELVEVTG